VGGKHVPRALFQQCSVRPLDRPLGWLPAAVTLPAGTYPTKAFDLKAASLNFASFVVPLEIHTFDAYIDSVWPTKNIQIVYQQQDISDSEFTFQYGQDAGSVQLVHDPCGSGETFMALEYGPSSL